VWINPPRLATKLCSYKLAFECTNNMDEYEALVLGLKTLKEMGARMINVHGDSELIVNKVKRIYQANHPRLRAYRNIMLDLLEEFLEYSLSMIPRVKIRLLMLYLLQPKFSKFQFFVTGDMRLKSTTD
jgi:ribonuclease HI